MDVAFRSNTAGYIVDAYDSISVMVIGFHAAKAPISRRIT
jgi:hypothetical protein